MPYSSATCFIEPDARTNRRMNARSSSLRYSIQPVFNFLDPRFDSDLVNIKVDFNFIQEGAVQRPDEQDCAGGGDQEHSHQARDLLPVEHELGTERSEDRGDRSSDQHRAPSI